MGEDSQSFPLAHYQAHHKPNEEQQLATFKILRKERSNKCFIYIFSTFVFLSVALLIFALIVLRVNSPSISLSSISNPRVSLSNNTNSSSPNSLNLSFNAEFTVDNSNFGPFNFDNGTVGLVYGGMIFGERSTGGGRAGAKGSKRMNVTVEGSAKNVSGSNGILNFSSFVKLRGRVRLIHIFRRRVSSEISCSMNLDLNTHQIQHNWVCE
ncbi:late embryogenesis abundant protein At1g64065 [Cucumis sativus]|uniref:Late embryogenesis abundant protein LEA-2 subgroup domain-containing protein n=1 Tax=Cucumis sativus TaxID=3659 RepID=A0A0A0KQT7_CUCSA|nr:late embryogenesis abundant protein At1g64065 [Cucumis sativus]